VQLSVREIRKLVSSMHELFSGSVKCSALEFALKQLVQREILSHVDVCRALGFAARLASKLRVFFPDGLEFSIQSVASQTLLTRQQCAALLAAGFFGVLLPHSLQEETGRETIGRELSLSSFSFAALLCGEGEKVLCILCYFHTLATEELQRLKEIVSFARRAELAIGADFWISLDRPLSTIVLQAGRIEDADALQADFANARLGGGILRQGKAQEESRFATCPECIVGVLFSEEMLANEAIVIVGSRQYTESSGFQKSFRCEGLLDMPICEPDELNRCGPHIVAFDALRLPGTAQYSEAFIIRELQKARVACLGDPLAPDRSNFATGNWGSGAFGGDPQLKSLIQWLAASAVGRDVEYYPYDDARMADAERVFAMLASSNVTRGDFFKLLLLAADQSRKGLSMSASAVGGVFEHLDRIVNRFI